MRWLLLFSCLWYGAAAGAAEPLVVTAVEWAQPRNGLTLTRYPALHQAVSELQQGQRLQLRYPGGDEGSLWASELQAWLVALGLSSDRIELLPGSARADAIELRVVGTPATGPQ